MQEEKELSVFKKMKGHWQTINRHKKEVMKLCFKAGLYKQGLLHDLSKYSPDEFIPGVKYYQGYRSPNNAQREMEGASTAWLHHKGRNKHHFEYWVDYPCKGLNDGRGKMVGMQMPKRYVVEMFCDRVAAGKIYNGDAYTDKHPLEYFEKGKDHYLMNPKTQRLLHHLLKMLAQKGEEETFSYIRKNILKNDKSR